ncbi:MAG: glycoside hydrolase family 5 protein [Magnetococcus sp. DMHC-6]
MNTKSNLLKSTLCLSMTLGLYANVGHVPDAAATPSSLTSISASDGTSKTAISITWTAVPGAIKYKVYRSTSSSSSSSKKVGETTTTAYSDTTAAPGVVYYYWVKVCDSTSCSGYSWKNKGYLQLSSPSGFSASNGTSATKVSIKWTAVPGATIYQIYRGTSTNSSESSFLGNSTTTTYSDTNAKVGTTYYYWAKACFDVTSSKSSCSSYSWKDKGWLLETRWISTLGNKFMNVSGQEIIFKGVSLIDLEAIAKNRPGSTIESMIDIAVANGSNIVRLVIWPNPDSGEGTSGFLANPQEYYDNYLKPALKHLEKYQNVYAIVDAHFTENFSQEQIQQRVQPVWDFLAPKLKENPQIIFELFNEPIRQESDQSLSWENFKSVINPLITRIRETHGAKNLILSGSPLYSQIGPTITDPLIGENIGYTAHIYPTHDWDWETHYGPIIDVFPVMISEFGWQCDGQIPTTGTTSQFGIPFLTWLSNKNVSWVAFVLDSRWEPKMLDSNNSYTSGECYMGTEILNHLP